MTNVLIRNVHTEDLERLRVAAAEQGVSLQSYLRDAMHAQAAYLRRQEALERVSERLRGRPQVPDDERQSVLDAIEAAHALRADELGDQAVQ